MNKNFANIALVLLAIDATLDLISSTPFSVATPQLMRMIAPCTASGMFRRTTPLLLTRRRDLR